MTPPDAASQYPRFVSVFAFASAETIADFAVAGFTLALAIATAVLSWQTSQAVKESKAATQAAVDEAEATKQLVQQGFQTTRRTRLPLVVPNLEKIECKSAGHANPSGVVVSVPIFNYGPGPAIGLQLTIWMLDEASDRRSHMATAGDGADITAISGNSSDVMIKTLRGIANDPIYPFFAEITYMDTAADKYRVRFRFFPEQHRGDSLIIDAILFNGSTESRLLSIFEPAPERTPEV